MAKAKVLRKFIAAGTFIANSAKRQFGWDDTAGAEALLIHQTDDSLKKISEDGLQALLARDPQTFTGANTFQKKVTLDLGNGSEDALLLDVAEPTSAEDRDSHSIVIRSAAYEAGVGETHDWRIKSIVRAVEGLQNQLIIEHQQDGGGYSSIIAFDESGEVIIPDKLQVGSASTWLRVDPKQTVSGGAGNVSQIFMQSGAGAISTSDDGSTYTNIQAVLFQSPFISKGASDTITTAATVRIQTPPSQGVNNYSLLVDTGESKLGGLLTAGGGILVTGGAFADNSIFKTSAYGMVIQGGTGTSDDFAITTAGDLFLVENPTGTLEWNFASGVDVKIVQGDLVVATSGQKIILGTNSEAEIYFDGTNLVLNPNAVGSGQVSVQGEMNIVNNVSGTAGYALEIQQEEAAPVLNLLQNSAGDPIINFNGTIAADANATISSLTNSGAPTHHLRVRLNGATIGWIPFSTNNPT